MALALGAGLAACANDDDKAPRATARLLRTGPLQDCAGALNPVACEGPHQFSVVDVRRDGDRVGVLVLLEGAQQVVLYLSDDQGRSFREVGVGGSLIYNYAWDAHTISLLLRQGRAWLLLGTAESAGSANSTGKALFAEWDLTTGKLGPLGTGSQGGGYLVPGPAEVSADGTVAVVQNWYDAGPGTNHSLIFRWNLATFTQGQGHTICSHPACYNTFWRARDDAKEWQAFGVLPDNPGGWSSGPGSVCRFLHRWRGDPTVNPYGESWCVPFSDWTSGDASGTDRFAQVFGADGLLYAVWTHNGRSRARTIAGASLTAPAALTAPIDLGPGAQLTAEGFNGRSKWSGLQLVRRPHPAGSKGTFVRLTATGAEEVNVPPWPCDGPCAHFDPVHDVAYGSLVWLEPLAGDEWLAFWIVDAAGDGKHQERLYAERVRATRSPLRLGGTGAAPIDEPKVPIPAHPGAAAPTGLLRACALVQQCGVGDLNNCLTSYATNAVVGHGSRDRARALLIAAAEGGCASLKSFWPKADCLASHCEAEGFTCEAYGCSGLPKIDPTFCDGRKVAYYCAGTKRVGCDSAGGETVLEDCADHDEVCSPGPPVACVLPGCSKTLSCEGDLSVSCQVHTHCEDFAQRCDGEHSCVTRADIPTDALCHWGTSQPFCAGVHWVFCMGNRLHYLDCVKEGFARCAPFESGVGPARCAP